MKPAASRDPIRGRVTVILSTHNRAATLGRAITSVLDQQLDGLELVVIDDASTDGTPSLLAAWRDDPRVRVLRNDTNLGLPASLNRGIGEASGEWLARIDDDDHWTDPAKLERQLAWVERHTDAVLLGTAYVDEWGRTITNPTDDAGIRDQMLMRCPFCHSSVLMHAAAVAEVGAYDASLPYAEDWDLWLRLGRRGRMGNLEDVTLVKARGDDTLSERYFHRQLSMAACFARRHAGHYPHAVRARFMHGFSRGFFSLFPVDGRVHRWLGRVFRRTFRLERSG